MTPKFYRGILDSLHDWEMKDYSAICNILDERYWRGLKAVVVSNDPYLLTLIFVSLIRRWGIEIHIVNPAEGTDETQRLIYGVDPDYVIVTDSQLKQELTGYRIALINGEIISSYAEEFHDEPESLEFTIVTYSPYPVKVHRVSSEMFMVMVNAFMQDLAKFELADSATDDGIIPIMTNNSDYLLYFLAIKMAKLQDNILPTANDVSFPIENRKLYLRHNRSKTLFIPKKEFVDLWHKQISSIFECRLVFKLYMKIGWLANMLVGRRLKKLFKGFENVLIIGILNNSYMIDILKSMSNIKFYSVFPIRSALMYGPISNSLDSIILTQSESRQDVMYDSTEGLSALGCRFTNSRHSNEMYSINDTVSRFKVGESIREGGYYLKQYFPLGSIENCFNKGDSLIFPETLEKVINSYPFVKDSVLLIFRSKVILVVNFNGSILDSNRINYGMIGDIMREQIRSLNKELPESYRIQGFAESASLLEQDRNGDVVRYPFNYCNRKWGG
jgi:hypothetical protein